MKAYDGRGKLTSISDKILRHLNLTDIDEIVQYVYSDINNKSKISNLSKLVIEAAEENDEVASSIIDNGIQELIDITMTIVDKTKEPMNIALAGGNI